MKVKKVNRYYCEFCRKAGCAGGVIKKHEASCTLNPNRVCRMCAMIKRTYEEGHVQPQIDDLIALLPRLEDCKRRVKDEDSGYVWDDYDQAKVNAALPALREKANECPACIMAALRQAKIPVPVASEFDFKKECAGIWNDINNARVEEDYR